MSKRNRKIKNQPEQQAAPEAEAAEATEAAELTAGQKMSAQLRAARVRYVPTTTASGNKSLHNNDATAQLLAGKSPEDVMSIVEGKLGLAKGSLAEKYAKLNPGQKRMNAGNLLRGAVKRGVVQV
jgi:hypothetical protein